MDLNKLTESLSSVQQKVPDALPILNLRRHSVDDLHRRLKKLLKNSNGVCGSAVDKGYWTRYDDRTLVRMPEGAYAVVYHASGAIKLSSGLGPMDKLFKETPSRESLMSRSEIILKDLGLAEQLPKGQSLTFERLWQTKASGFDRSGKASDIVLCRAVGAYRHMMGEVPVLGPASVAVKIAGDDSMDSLSMLMRGPGFDELEQAKILHPEKAVRRIIQRLSEKFSHAREADEVLVEADRELQFGYINLPKRKLQRLLAPAYLASFSVTHAEERQAFTVIVPATEKTYVEFEPPGHESPVMNTSKLAARCCC
jgi:hypothetical protein